MMKYLLPLFILFGLCAQESEPPSKSYWDYHPLHIGGSAIALSSADVDVKNGDPTGDLTFNKANAFAYIFLPVSRTSYFLPRVEYNIFTFDWNKNPKFHETRFHYMQFALTFLSIALEKWRWIARVDYNIDANHFSKPKTYGLYSVLLWGTHEMHEKWHFHIGGFGYTGFEGREVYPVIGFDFAPTKKWMFQAVFPITYSIDYTINDQWRASVKARPLKERFRTDQFQPQPRSVFNYSTVGAEFNLHYEKFLHLEFELFAGYNFGGNMYIKDKSGHNPIYTTVKGAPYVGANLNWGL